MTATRKATMNDLLGLPLWVGVRELAVILHVGQNEAYRLAAADGKIEGVPVHRRSGEWVATRPDIFRHFGLPPDMVRAPEPAPPADEIVR
jgi:hypothetical protein